MKKNSLGGRPATILDVAELSHTSAATVSRVLSKSDYPVSSETEARVQDAARALHYAPNLAGHLLKSKSAKTLGIIIPSLQNPFFIQLVAGIEDAAAAEGYMTFVFNSRRSVVKEREFISKVAQLHLRGLLLSSLDNDSEVLCSFLSAGSYAALFEADFSVPLHSHLLDAMPDMAENSTIATRALIERGHRRIALLTTPLTKNNRRKVNEGYSATMELCRIPPEDRLVLEAGSNREKDDIIYEFEAGCELAERLYGMKKKFTAIVAVNDLVACGIIHRLVALKVKIPEEVSVIGIDNIPQDIMITPTLSTVDQESYRHGYDVALRLMQSIEQEEDLRGEKFYIPPTLIIRDSVRDLRSTA